MSFPGITTLYNDFGYVDVSFTNTNGVVNAEIHHSHEGLEQLDLQGKSVEELHELMLKVSGDLAVFKDIANKPIEASSQFDIQHQVYTIGMAIGEDKLILNLVSERLKQIKLGS